MNYFEIIFQYFLFVCAVFYFYISIPVLKDALKSAKLEIKKIKNEMLKNRTDKTKVNRDFVLDKANLIEKLIEDIYNGDCSAIGSRGKAVNISIENCEMEIDNVRIIPSRLFNSIFYEVYILISPEYYFEICNEYSRKNRIFSKTHIPQPLIVKYPFFTNKSCEQYEIFLTNLKPYIDETGSYRCFESNHYILSFHYCP